MALAFPTLRAAIASPQVIPPASLHKQAAFRLSAHLWRTEYGCFLHQGDGPRGWVEPLSLSARGEVVVPIEGGAAIVGVVSEPTVLGATAFEGRLRASRVTDDEVVLVNDEGRVFRSRKPHG
jgi:hypothetical protein